MFPNTDSADCPGHHNKKRPSAGSRHHPYQAAICSLVRHFASHIVSLQFGRLGARRPDGNKERLAPFSPGFSGRPAQQQRPHAVGHEESHRTAKLCSGHQACKGGREVKVETRVSVVCPRAVTDEKQMCDAGSRHRNVSLLGSYHGELWSYQREKWAPNGPVRTTAGGVNA